mmetsp:Transcript_35043/g.26147  ORF Transcript_35043/g.26147 Transcript_35043/m.26147 type:complete len:227 (+) Transcript_35043:533-1213(+)|eukprot:CAMPEP_0202964600 /NCGR_PEP_ID=MMETSP1396-20130829/8675_1 /ASSEMBLY_ACC=CAM_ASM_000872 /TAXON_ID= /ORGANISM="Pseudokeronopsis sp., Strain Brazil" /LENGTH=226 /DNA_ID=CAMNT_0049686819 /DNA_START=407 /DNA_END=1087 /DNA_ORIENTATION=-
MGGVSVITKRDLLLKKSWQVWFDLDSVEFFSLKSRSWSVYNSKLNIARHSSAACVIKEFVYVVGGHKVELPGKFINTIERCHNAVQQSYFELINVKATEVALSIANQLAFPLPEDNGILILAASLEDPRKNFAYFIDLKAREIKQSKFGFSVGSVNHWHNSRMVHEKRVNFLTDSLQILRFELQACEWSFFDLQEVAWEEHKKEEVIFEDGSHVFYEDVLEGNASF